MIVYMCDIQNVMFGALAPASLEARISYSSGHYAVMHKPYITKLYPLDYHPSRV